MAAGENLPLSFAEPWSMPATAVQPYQHDWKQGWPAMAPANPADPRQLAPNAVKPAAGAGHRGKKEMAHRNSSAHASRRPGAPPVVDRWRTRALIVGVVFSVAAARARAARPRAHPSPLDHVLRAWVLGLMLTFGWSVGGLALLMVQYCSGGKWGLLLRRPLEAMTRTLPLVFGYWIVVALTQSRLFMWANHAIVDKDFKPRPADPRPGGDSSTTAIRFKHPMLNPTMFVVVGPGLLRHLGFLHLAAEFDGPPARGRLARQHSRTGSRSSRTSPAPASWSTRSP